MSDMLSPANHHSWTALETKAKNLSYDIREFSDCSQEPLSFCGAIQSFGFLLAVHSKSWVVSAVGANWSDAIETDLNPNILGKKIDEVLALPFELTELSFQRFFMDVSRQKNKVKILNAKSNNLTCINFFISGSYTNLSPP